MRHCASILMHRAMLCTRVHPRASSCNPVHPCVMLCNTVQPRACTLMQHCASSCNPVHPVHASSCNTVHPRATLCNTVHPRASRACILVHRRASSCTPLASCSPPVHPSLRIPVQRCTSLMPPTPMRSYALRCILVCSHPCIVVQPGASSCTLVHPRASPAASCIPVHHPSLRLLVHIVRPVSSAHARSRAQLAPLPGNSPPSPSNALPGSGE